MPFTQPTAPFTQPTVPFMPPMPPTAPASPMPPAPADYTQQLFSYLQAWRQYLEQMAGARPGPGQASTAQPTAQPGNAPEEYPADDGGRARPARPPDSPIPPGDDTGSKTIPESYARTGNPTWPPVLNLPPSNYDYSQVTGTGVDPALDFDPPPTFERGPGEPLVLKRPTYDYRTDIVAPHFRPDLVSRPTSEAAAQLQVGSPFLAKIERLGRTASAKVEEAGQKPSP
jgi:hypothetical protein